MKLEKLTIHNLASIEDATVDFATQPLSDSEVFLITGKTGSGKSTLLDAICLALFADTPRLESTKMEGDVGDGGVAGKTVRIKDTRQLMRHGAADCFARLSFVGSNGVRYEATWSAARAHGKATGTMQPKRWTLLNLATGALLTKEVDIRNEMKEAIGLDFKQFRRTTLLAQGEFTQFLNSRDNEKAEILEKITGASVYKDIGQKVYVLTEMRRKEWESVQNRLDALQLLTEEEVKGLEMQRMECQKQAAELRKEYALTQQKQMWIQTDKKLQKAIDGALDDWKKATEALRTSEGDREELTIRQWDATAQPREWMAGLDHTQDVLRSLGEKQEVLALRYGELLSGRAFATTELLRLQKEVERVEQVLADEKPRAGIYENINENVRLLVDLDDTNRRLELLKKQICEWKEREAHVLAPELKRKNEQKEKLENELDGVARLWKSQEDALAGMHLEQLRGDKEKAQMQQGRMAVAKERMAVVEQERKRQAEARILVEQLNRKLRTMETEQMLLEARVAQAEVARTAARSLYEHQRETVSKWARSLRATLHVGEVCPLCQQRIRTELPHEDTLDVLLQEAETALKEAEKQFDLLSQQAHTLKAERKAIQQQAARASLTADNHSALEQALAGMNDAIAACGLDVNSNPMEEQIHRREAETQTIISQLQQRITEGEALDREVKKTRLTVETLRKQVEDAANAYSKVEKQRDEGRQKVLASQQLADDRELHRCQLVEELSRLLEGVNDTGPWMAQPRELAARLTEESKTYLLHCRQRDGLGRELVALKAKVTQVDEVMSSLLVLMPTWAECGVKAPKEVPTLTEDGLELRVQVTALLETQKETGERAGRLERDIKNYLRDHTDVTPELLRTLTALTSEEVSNMRRRRIDLSNRVLEKKTLLDAARKQWKTHQMEKPELTDEDTDETLTVKVRETEAAVKAMDEKQGALLATLKKNERTKQQADCLLHEAAAKKELYERWAQLNQLIGDAGGVTFRKIAQSYVLQSLIHSANAYLSHLTDRYQLCVTSGTFIISIIDAYQGYSVRAASTISGGESFLVSLALALALSDIGQRLSVDTLFIDEGFGTLSGEPLQRAVDTLRTLHTKVGRHVGIISHVEELRERIPVQIRVEQEGHNSSSTVDVSNGGDE